MRFLLLAFLMAFLLSGCISQEKLAIGKVEDVSMDAANPKAIQLNVLLPVDNENFSGFTITEIDFDFFINGQYLGKITNNEAIRIKGNRRQDYRVPLTLEIKNMFAGMMILLNKSDKQKTYKVGLKGYVKGRSCLISKKVEVKQEDSWTF